MFELDVEAAFEAQSRFVYVYHMVKPGSDVLLALLA